MKLCRLFYFIVFVLLIFVSACRDGQERDNKYTGISELISERNKTRHEASEKKNVKKTDSKPAEEKIITTKKESDSQTEEEISSSVFYEEEVDIIGSESRQILSKGIAYINKKGQIVKVKVLKE